MGELTKAQLQAEIEILRKSLKPTKAELRREATAREAAEIRCATALEHQAATSYILRVISSSPSDVRPVFAAIVHSARRLLRGLFAKLVTVDNGLLHLNALTSTSEEGDAALRRLFPLDVRSAEASALMVARVVRERVPYVVNDTETDPRVRPSTRETARARGYRSIAWVPLIHEAGSIGAIGVTRQMPGVFSAAEIALLQTFADQAVIAIGNVRLFTELQARYRPVTDVRERHAAIAEIPHAPPASLNEAPSGFEAIMRGAVTLIKAASGTVVQYDGLLMHLVSRYNVRPDDGVAALFPKPADRTTPWGRAIEERRVVHIPDLGADPECAHLVAVAGGWRSVLSVPMLRDGALAGVITLAKQEREAFAETEVRLLETIADLQ